MTSTSRKSILAALVAALAVPAIASAASSGLTASEIEAGQVYLASQRTTHRSAAQVARAERPTPKAERSAPKAGDVSDVTSQEHEKQMEAGLIRMTKGSMAGAKR